MLKRCFSVALLATLTACTSFTEKKESEPASDPKPEPASAPAVVDETTTPILVRAASADVCSSLRSSAPLAVIKREPPHVDGFADVVALRRTIAQENGTFTQLIEIRLSTVPNACEWLKTRTSPSKESMVGFTIRQENGAISRGAYPVESSYTAKGVYDCPGKSGGGGSGTHDFKGSFEVVDIDATSIAVEINEELFKGRLTVPFCDVEERAPTACCTIE